MRLESTSSTREDINKVEAWVSRNFWKVVQRKKPKDKPHENFLCDYDSRTIFTDPDVTEEVYLFTLLHEVGHMVIAHPWTDLSSVGRRTHAEFRAVSSGCRSKSLSGKISKLNEEMEAWAEGERIARHLGITLNQTRYLHLRTKNLMTYIQDLFGKVVGK